MNNPLSDSSASECKECGLALSTGAQGSVCPGCTFRLALSPEAMAQLEAKRPVPPGLKSRFFGDYEILSEIARGGMGVVFRARQLGLNRVVALKMVQPHHLFSDEARLRFRVEIEAVAQLHHPHIVALYESGEHDGAHFFTMRLVEGSDLAVHFQGNHSLRRYIQLLVKVCRAVHYAHQRGILHRDLKPSNILVDEQGEPHVADFGLAKSLDQATGITFTSSVLGSPNYMAPEQASGKVRQLTTAVDVYGLGAILYHILAARPPFQADTPIETLRQVVDHEVTPPRSIDAGVDRDLETIALKCLRKEPAERYGTADDLAVDLERWLAGQPIQARKLGRTELVWRWMRRRPALTAAMAVALCALAIALLMAFQAQRTEQARLAEKHQGAIDKALLTAWSGDLDGTEQAIREAELAGVSAGELRMLRGMAAVHRGDYHKAVQDLEQAWKLSPQSVAVCSMLMKAQALMGQWHKTEGMFEVLDRLTPSTPEDFLFLGSLEELVDPRKALVSLDRAVRLRPTGIARLYRGSARVNFAQDTAHIEDVEAAINDVRAAMTLLPANAEVLALSLKAHLVARGIYEDNHRPEKRDAAWLQAQVDAVALESYPDNQAALVARATYVKHASDDWTSLEKLRTGRGGTNSLLDYLAAVSLYRRGAWQEALNVFDATRMEVGSQYTRGFILAELADGPELARKEVLRLWALEPSTGDTLAIQLTLRLLGRKDEAITMCRQARSRAPLAPSWRKDWYCGLLDYSCGELSEGELITLAGSSRYSQCEAHFFIGITKLGEGDRKAAREHFRAAVATGVFNFFDYDWSHAFLARLNQDPNWPSWIPVKPEK